MPELTWEARIDREPVPHMDALGHTSYEWIGHESTYHPPGADAVALYWAPFWGARNEGEQLDAAHALRLFGVLLDEVRGHSGGLPIFIDQLNVIDNTLGFERNAVLLPSALSEFMDGAYCAMRKAAVFGYAYWTTQDYAESPLYNPSFAYGLEGWNLTTSDGTNPAQRLSKQTLGDFDLRLTVGDRLHQIIPSRRGRLPTTTADGRLTARICVSVDAGESGVIEAAVGAAGVPLTFSGTAERVCSAIQTHAGADTMELELRGVRGAVRLTNVMLFDHVQEGGLYGFDGSEGMLMPELRKLNGRFAQAKGNDNTCPQPPPTEQK
jgi:hypothetical protein